MGRLTDFLGMFGIHSSSSSSLVGQPSSTNMQSANWEPAPTTGTSNQSQSNGSESFVKSTQDIDSVHVMPDKEEYTDCLSCKLIGTTTMTAAGAYITWTFWKQSSKLKGFQVHITRINGIVIGSMFLQMAVMRGFNIGLFNPKHKGRSFTEIMFNKASKES